RPFTVTFWDGSCLPSTANDGPSFLIRSPGAVAHVLRAPGQLGLGRAYVSGLLEVDDLDATVTLLDTWKPPPLDRVTRVRLALVSIKLGLTAGDRVLDVGCGWGSFAIHAASRHGAQVLGITLSRPQAAVARRRAEEAGLGDQVEIRVMDYRELNGASFDAIA